MEIRQPASGDVISEAPLEWKVDDFKRGESPQRLTYLEAEEGKQEEQITADVQKNSTKFMKNDENNSRIEEKELIDMLDKDLIQKNQEGNKDIDVQVSEVQVQLVKDQQL